MLTEYEIKNVSALNEITEVISNKAKELGLDFYPTIFEVVPANTLYTFGAYTMPTRYGHWSFGKGYFKMKTMYEHGFIKIYEMVINTNPCYAFLVEDNTATQNMLIISHVLAHND
ncbi:MAG: SpoVR family protein, partial [Bacteroidales bacterium]